MYKIKGSIVSLVTPMNKNKSLDIKSFNKLIEFHINNKTDCVLLAGTTGECSTLNNEEKIELIHEAKKTIKKKKFQ